MLDRSTKTLAPEYFRYLLELEGNLAVRHLYYLSLLDFEFDLPADDEKLSSLIRHIRSDLRKTDMMGRMGFLRFCVAMQFTECKDALQIAQRIRKRAKSHPFFLIQKKRKGGLSIGGACFPIHASSIHTLPIIAERMLTAAKMNGGNRIYFPTD